MLLGLRFGELFVLVFIVVAIIGAPYWPRIGGAIGAALSGKKGGAPTPPP